MQILVIEDDVTQQIILKGICDKIGAIGTFCSSAETGLVQAFTGVFDLIFLDIMLPGKNGVYALKKIRENLKTRDTPVMVMSGDRSRETLLQCTSYGISEYIIKPVSADLLMQKLRLLQSIIMISKDATDKGAFSSVTVEHRPRLTTFTFNGQFGRYSVQQFQNLYTPLLKAQTQDNTIILNLASLPTFGPQQADPLRFISDIIEPKQALIIGGKNFGPLMPLIHNFATRLFMNDADAMKFINLQGAEEKGK